MTTPTPSYANIPDKVRTELRNWFAELNSYFPEGLDASKLSFTKDSTGYTISYCDVPTVIVDHNGNISKYEKE